jgi:hypothetical protein
MPAPSTLTFCHFEYFRENLQTLELVLRQKIPAPHPTNQHIFNFFSEQVSKWSKLVLVDLTKQRYSISPQDSAVLVDLFRSASLLAGTIHYL